MFPVAVLAVMVVTACAVADDATVESITSEVNVGAAGHFTVATTALQGALRDAQRATGALFIPRLQFPNIRGTCGVTFVDRTHAITAGHCVNVTHVPDQRPLTVEFYDIDPELDWHAAATLSGTFPDYDHPRLRDAPGYGVTQTACRVVVRCRYGNLACPANLVFAGVDIALLQCDPGLPADREPVEVAQHDDQVGPVTVFWFHEIYDAPMQRPLAGDPALDLFLHYTQYTTIDQNAHYATELNELLPLISADFDASHPRRRLRRSGSVVWTDAYACHGTSGSGFMQQNPATGRFELLGPTINGTSDWATTRLCADPATQEPGRATASYTALEYTRAIAQLATP
jgi:hypothetical protein